MNSSNQPSFNPTLGLNRRSFLRRSALVAALSTPAAAFLRSADTAEAALPFAPGTELDLAILNFALNLEYLEGNYYSLGVYGKSVDELGVTLPTGSMPPIVKAGPQVKFATSTLQQYATEIANDELAHIKFIQTTITALGGTPIAQPSLDLLNSFNTIAKLAGIAATFDPFADETSFFLGGFSLTDVGVTAYAGSAAALTNKDVIKGAAGLLAVESYHDSTLRLTIFNAGTDAQEKAQAVSTLRDSLDDDDKKDKDQGLANADGTPNIVPTDEHSLIFTRTPRQVLNIVYGGFKATSGGFYPNGVNGDIK